jgi:hypothetical protein
MVNAIRPAVRSVRRHLFHSLRNGERAPVVVKVGSGYGVGVRTDKGIVLVGPVKRRRVDVEQWAEDKTGKAPKGKTVPVGFAA